MAIHRNRSDENVSKVRRFTVAVFFYCDFDGHRPKRMLVKIIGE